MCIRDRDFGELVLICETLQERILHNITDKIERHFPEVKLILMAGPSSSGKTTTANRLCIQLRSVGIRPVMISMDDYFLDVGTTPLNERGNPDYCLLYTSRLKANSEPFSFRP